jgi:Domain of unknown function (DUF4145)
MSSQAAPLFAHCNKCTGETKHDVVIEHKEPWSSSSTCGHFSFNGTDIYTVLRCRGCETVHYRTKSGNSECTDPETGGYEWCESRYPFHNHRKQPEWVSELGADTGSVLEEGYKAVNAELTRSAAMCVRAALDVCFTDIVGDIGGFKRKLDRLVDEKRITAKQAAHFHCIIDLGNASAHRAYNPTVLEVVALLECTESVLYSLIILPKKTAVISAKTPKRSNSEPVHPPPPYLQDK